MKAKRSYVAWLAVGSLFSLLLAYRTSPAGAAGQHPQVTIEHYSLGTGTNQYQIDSTTADIINKSHPWLRVRVIPGLSVMEGIGITQGLPVEKKKYVLLTGDNISQMQGVLGMPPYPRKFPDLREVAFWWTNQWGFATYNPNIKTSQDLKGKTIAVRPKGGPWDLFYEFVLKYCWGIQDSVRLAPTAPSDFSEAMLTGTAAAAHWGSREVAQGVFLLDAGQSEMRLKRKTYFIPISKAEFERGVKSSGNPLSFGWMEVPPGAYGPGDPQGAVGMVYYAPGPASWDVIDPEAVYEYVKAINDNRDKYQEYSPVWKGAVGGPKMSPLHLLAEQWVASGALKYYKEQGWAR